MAWNIELTACSSYELDCKPTAEDIEQFIQCFVSDLLDGYIQINDDVYELNENE